MVEVFPERLRHPLQVLRAKTALEIAVALAEPAKQDIGPGLQVDDEVRSGKPLVEQLEDVPVELELVGAERDRCEDRVLGEEVVGDGPPGEQLPLAERALLAVALEQEEELGLEGVSFGLVVELPQ